MGELTACSSSLVRTLPSQGNNTSSNLVQVIRRRRLLVRTGVFQAPKAGSIPVVGTNGMKCLGCTRALDARRQSSSLCFPIRRSIPTAEESGLDPVQSGFESLGRYTRLWWNGIHACLKSW